MLVNLGHNSVSSSSTSITVNVSGSLAAPSTDDSDAIDELTLNRWLDIDYQQLGSRSTYASYDRVGHPPARYNATSRTVVDESSISLDGERNLDGVLDLVSHSRKLI